jgi:hypothetical protein
MLEAILIIIAVASSILFCGYIATNFDVSKPVKVASWKGYTLTTSVWFWKRAQLLGIWLKGLF